MRQTHIFFYHVFIWFFDNIKQSQTMVNFETKALKQLGITSDNRD